MFRERRASTRFRVTLRMEIWPENEPRKSETVFVSTRDISLRGIYFHSEVAHAVGSKLNFSVVFLREFSGKETDLIAGTARIVRCERVSDVDISGFGVALAIERTAHLHGE
jgi:c-di-GMP-binding flagellar brake protein YcgR